MPQTVRSAAPIPIVRIAPAAGLGRTDLFPSRPSGTAERVRGGSIGKEGCGGKIDVRRGWGLGWDESSGSELRLKCNFPGRCQFC